MLRCQLTDEILRSLHRASALGDVLTRLERHPIECRAIGTRLRRTEHQHGRSRVSLPDLGGDVAQRRVDPGVLVEHDDLEVDALLVGVRYDVRQFGLRRVRRRAHPVVAHIRDHQVHTGVDRCRCRIPPDGRTHLGRDVRRKKRDDVRSGHTSTVRDGYTVQWQHAPPGTRLRQDCTQHWGGLQDKRTVRIVSAADTARRGEI